jgi:hypothetical protein
MLRRLALSVSLLALAGTAYADCSSGHSPKDAMAPSDAVLASTAPKAGSAPAAAKQAATSEGGKVDSTAKPAQGTKTAKKPAAAGERVVLASQPAR